MPVRRCVDRTSPSLFCSKSFTGPSESQSSGMSYEERDSNLFKSARVNHSETNRAQRLEIHIIALGRPATSGEPSAAVRPSSRQKSAKQPARSELCCAGIG